MARRPKSAAASAPPTQPAGRARIEYEPLSKMLGAVRNPKDHDLPTIGASLRRFGMVEMPVIDERTGRMVAGHGRVEQLTTDRASGRRPPERVEVREDGEWMIPVIRGIAFKDDVEAEAYLVTSNQSAISGGWRDREIAELLRDHHARGADALVGTGFTDEQVQSMLAGLAASELGSRSGGGGPPEDFPEFKGDEKKTCTCPKCGFPVVVE